MPKARRKSKKARLKIKARTKAKPKGGNRSKPKKTDGRERDSLTLLTAVIDRLGASVTRSSDSELTVTAFNHPSFVIDLKKLAIVGAATEATETTTVTQPDAA